MGLLSILLGASTASAALPADAIGEPTTAGVGGLLGLGVHYIGRSIRDWIAADAALRRELAAQVVETRDLIRDLRELLTRTAPILLAAWLAACGALPARHDPTPEAQRLQWALQGAAAGAAAASVTCETADQGCYSGVSWPAALVALVLTGAAIAVEASTLPPATPSAP